MNHLTSIIENINALRGEVYQGGVLQELSKIEWAQIGSVACQEYYCGSEEHRKRQTLPTGLILEH